MGDNGMKISIAGKDVKTGADKDMVFTSKYNTLKGSISGNGSLTLTSGTRTQKGTADELSITHNLGYIPFVQVWIKVDGIVTNDVVFHILPIQNLATVTTEEEYYFYVDDEKLYLDFFWEDTDTGVSKDIEYEYFIFIDKGDL